MIYLDNNATTRLAPEVLAAMMPFLTDEFGNPSSAHQLGRTAREAVENARLSVADLVGASEPLEIVFTSGGTESDNWAILGSLGQLKRHVITTGVEHEAVRKTVDKLETEGCRVTRLAVDTSGMIDLDELSASLAADTGIVSIMHANNETGVLFPIKEAAAMVKERSNALFHVDGVNAVGKVETDLKSTGIDLYSLSAHKFHGPKGIGALYVRNGVKIGPLLTGGGQEGNRRSGTLAVHQIAGFGAAAGFVSDLSAMKQVRRLRDKLENEILEKIPNSRLNGTSDPASRVPNTTNISFENTNGEQILARLNDQHIFVSTGSACASADHSASPVLQAMNIPYSYAMGSIRFSLGRFTTVEEIDEVLRILPGIVEELRSMAATA